MLLALVILTTQLLRSHGAEYLVPTGYINNIHAATGEEGGRWQVRAYVPPFMRSYQSFSRGTTGDETHIVKKIDFDISIYVDARNVGGSYSPLPISALGTRYIFSSCPVSSERHSTALVIATHSQATDINITFRLDGNITYGDRKYRDGDTLTVSLDAYQTWAVNSSSDLTGSIVSTTGGTVAVFSKTLYDNEVVCVDQLPPVRYHGQEYVVAVNDRSLSQLQIVSDHSDTQIMFNNGSNVSIGIERLYRQSLGLNESLYFTTTRPVMTTLCGNVHKNIVKKDFVVVPPVSYYIKQTSLPSSSFGTKILTGKYNQDLQVRTSFFNLTVTWADIPSSPFKVGAYKSYFPSTIQSSVDFMVLNFDFDDITNGGSSLSSQTTDADTAVVIPSGDGRVYATAGEVGGMWEVQSQLAPYTQGNYSMNYEGDQGTFNHAGIVQDFDEGTCIYATRQNMSVRFGGAIFTPLSISSLGTKYIVSSCHPSSSQLTYTLALLIATHSQKTDVSITFSLDGNVTYDGRTYSDGDTLTVSLQEYQTWRITTKFDLSGTVIRTKMVTIAVYSETLTRGISVSFDQLLPVSRHGQEYVVAVDDFSYIFRYIEYELQIISEHKDTQIMFNNGSTVSMDERRPCRSLHTGNESLYFNATRPVMATLCGMDGFVVVPPVSAYVMKTNLLAFPVTVKGFKYSLTTMKILSKSTSVVIKEVQHSIKTASMEIEWVEIPNCSYSVGTVRTSEERYIPFIHLASETTFTVLSYGSLGIYNGGYNFSQLQNTENPPRDKTDIDLVVIVIVGIVGAGSALAVTTAMMFFGGVVRRRKRRSDNQQVKQGERPPHPPPGAPPPLVRA